MAMRRVGTQRLLRSGLVHIYLCVARKEPTGLDASRPLLFERGLQASVVWKRPTALCRVGEASRSLSFGGGLSPFVVWSVSHERGLPHVVVLGEASLTLSFLTGLSSYVVRKRPPALCDVGKASRPLSLVKGLPALCRLTEASLCR